mgnify:CR=1 FL=1
MILSDNSFGRASVPSGASTGIHEAIELRDHDLKRFSYKGVKKIIEKIINEVKPIILSKKEE